MSKNKTLSAAKSAKKDASYMQSSGMNKEVEQ